MKLRYKKEMNHILSSLLNRKILIENSMLSKSESEIEDIEIAYSVFRGMFNSAFDFDTGYLVTRIVNKQDKLSAFDHEEVHIKYLINRFNTVRTQRYLELIKVKKEELKAIDYWRSLVEQGKL